MQAVPITSKVVKSNTFHGRGVLDTTLCYKVCQLIATGQWFSPGPPVSPTNKTESHDITEILLKVALDIIKLNLNQYLMDPSTVVDRVLGKQVHR